MNKEQRITVYKSNNIIEKIRNFFTKIFHKSKYKDNNFNEQEIPYTNNNFKEQIVIKEDEEKLRLLKLQKDYENELIEEDISPEDYQKLLDLYDEQNKKISEEIERDRIEIKNMLQKLKK